MSDTLIIHDLSVDCRLGVTESEQEQRQPVWIDLEVAVDAARAAQRDDVHETIDYARLVVSVQQYAQHRSFRLLETLAEELAALVLKDYETPEVLVRVKKRAVPGIDYAAVEIHRSRS